MTLHEFLDRTATINDRDIRPALALALKNEIPRSREGYARFYRRVMDHLNEAHRVVWSRRCGARLAQVHAPSGTVGVAA